MIKSQELTLKSETGKKVKEEKYMTGVNEDKEVTVVYTFEHANNEPPRTIVYQIFEAGKTSSGNFTSAGLNVSGYNPEHSNLYPEIEKTCKLIANIS